MGSIRLKLIPRHRLRANINQQYITVIYFKKMNYFQNRPKNHQFALGQNSSLSRISRNLQEEKNTQVKNISVNQNWSILKDIGNFKESIQSKRTSQANENSYNMDCSPNNQRASKDGNYFCLDYSKLNKELTRANLFERSSLGNHQITEPNSQNMSSYQSIHTGRQVKKPPLANSANIIKHQHKPSHLQLDKNSLTPKQLFHCITTKTSQISKYLLQRTSQHKNQDASSTRFQMNMNMRSFQGNCDSSVWDFKGAEQENVYDVQNQRKAWSINQFTFECLLGQGSFATVRLARDKQTGEKYAVKTYFKNKMIDKQKQICLDKEIEVLNVMDHPSIVKLFSVVSDDKSIYLIMEYASSLSLQSYLKQKSSLKEEDARYIFKQLLNAIRYIHDKGLAHRDIKLDNILLVSNLQIKLIDFGFATQVGDIKKNTLFCGTPNYMSPEMLQKIPHNPQTSDIWSCGILLYQLFFGEFPYKAMSNNELLKKIQNMPLKIPDHIQISNKAQRVLKLCLEKNFRKRSNAAQILNDDWFN